MTSIPVQLMTLCILRDGNRILLAMKKRDFGKGNWNGYGGKLEKEESIEEALVREVKEESTVDITKFAKRGDIFFHFADITRHVHIYEGMKWQGEPKESEEMDPKWFSINDLPYDKMWTSDKEWYRYFLKRIPFKGDVEFDENYKIISMDIKEV